MNTEKGVRLADTVSPKQFTSCLGIFSENSTGKLKKNMNGEYLRHLQFVADIVFISETKKEL